VRFGLGARRLRIVIDLDLKSYFDTVRHDLLLSKLARRIQDDDVLWLCKRILKAGGSIGLPQGSAIGPLWANVYLNEVDKMLEQAQDVTRQGVYTIVEYTRFADDLIVLASADPRDGNWTPEVERRLREEFSKLGLTVNEEKSRIVDFGKGQTFDFLGYTFRLTKQRKDPSKPLVLCTPQKKKRLQFLRELKAVMRHRLHVPVERVVREVINPRVRGWVNYFRWGHASHELGLLKQDVELKVRRFASRQRPKRHGGRAWTTWSYQEIYGTWGLYSDYRVAWCRGVAKG
jgi:RNA-directed DNA polymerase